ncbi:MAG: hypothetical protein P4N24_15625 [Acidobacteriota bacterium]|nr:hypothetical protein [Acidobacteriota bacterium]
MSISPQVFHLRYGGLGASSQRLGQRKFGGAVVDQKSTISYRTDSPRSVGFLGIGSPSERRGPAILRVVS